MTTLRQWWSRVRRVRLTRRSGILAAASAAVVVALVTVLVVVATSGGHRKELAGAPATTPTRTPTHTQAPPKHPKPKHPKPKPKPKPINPLTGRAPSPRSVVAVKIDDTAAGRPQRSIDKADIVYIEQAEGGLTRLLAVYNTTLPTVEPVRSTRAGDEALAMQFGPIDYVASGGSGGELAPLDRSPLRADINDRGGPGFARDPTRPIPYNLTANLAVAAAKLHGPKAKDIGLTWSSQPANRGSRPGAAIRTVVGGTPVAFFWRAKLHRYVRVIDGTVAHASDGARVATPNVVVQFCRVTVYPQDVDSAGNPAKYTHTIGRGKVVVFRGGRRIDGTWTRSSRNDGTHLRNAHGKPIALAPGGAWFVLVATGAPLS
jgi:Protein of unknown function (DUF3048) N-terminal domain/Protein of unknown function (DUF3048) C-terminal domain